MAKWSDCIELIKTRESINESGFAEQATEQIRSVFCNIKSVGYSEFYKAQQAGMKAELKVDLRLQDYEEETMVKIDARNYRVLRTYKSRNGDFIELTLTDIGEENG